METCKKHSSALTGDDADAMEQEQELLIKKNQLLAEQDDLADFVNKDCEDEPLSRRVAQKMKRHNEPRVDGQDAAEKVTKKPRKDSARQLFKVNSGVKDIEAEAWPLRFDNDGKFNSCTLFLQLFFS